MTEQSIDNLEEMTYRRQIHTLTVADVCDYLESLAHASPSANSASYGLQLGTKTAAVRHIVVTPMPSKQAISVAVEKKANMIISAVPLIANPISHISWDEPLGTKFVPLAQRHISFYALSSAFADVPGGFDEALAEHLGIESHAPLLPSYAEPQFKFVVFVPHAQAANVQQAAYMAGAGTIGNYTNCVFKSEGTGTFLPQPGANPVVGEVGKLEETSEIRMEMRVSERSLQAVIDSVIEAHPYEQVAYDIYPLRENGKQQGRGRIGELPLQVSLDTVLEQVNDALELGVDNPLRCSHRPSLPIDTLAVVSGDGLTEELMLAACQQGASAVVIGSASLTDWMLADSGDTVLIDVGYAASITPGLRRLALQLKEYFKSQEIQVTYVP